MLSKSFSQLMGGFNRLWLVFCFVFCFSLTTNFFLLANKMSLVCRRVALSQKFQFKRLNQNCTTTLKLHMLHITPLPVCRQLKYTANIGANITANTNRSLPTQKYQYNLPYLLKTKLLTINTVVLN